TSLDELRQHRRELDPPLGKLLLSMLAQAAADRPWMHDVNEFLNLRVTAPGFTRAFVPDVTLEQPPAAVERTVSPPAANRTWADSPEGQELRELAPDELPADSRLGRFRLLGVL